MNASRQASGLRRELNLFDATCIVVGAIVGVGIFFTPSRVALLAGSGQLTLIAWGTAGAIALLGALTFAELGGMYSRSGAQYDVLRDSYGPLVAFLFVFCNATAIQAGAIAVIATICAQNISFAVVGHSTGQAATLLLSMSLVIFLCIANWIGVRWGSRIQNLTVFAKVATLLAVVALALWAGDSATSSGDNLDVTSTSPDGSFWNTTKWVYAALVPCLFSFGGWQHALWIGGELRQPKRDAPRAIILGVSIVVFVYLLANWAYLDLLGYAGVSQSSAIAADAVGVILPGTGERIVAAAVAFSAFGVLNAQLLSGPRLVYAMACDGRFFSAFKKLDSRFATPMPAIVLLGALAITLLLSAHMTTGNPVQAVDRLLTGVVSVDGAFFVLTGLALFVLRQRRPHVPRPIRVPVYPLVPLLFVIGEIGVVAGAYADPSVRSAALIGVAWVSVALVFYLVWFRKRVE